MSTGVASPVLSGGRIVAMTVELDNSGRIAMYHPLDAVTVAQYIATCPPLDDAVASGAALDAREVGDGNINLVFVVSSTAGSSAVLKQALPYVRLVGESWPLTTARNKLERRAYALYDPIVPDLVPRVHHGDDALALFVMDDLSRLEIVRRGHVKGRLFPRLAGDVGRFCAETLLRTSDFYLASGEKKALVAQFINPELCKITEDLVLTDPFYDAATNAYEPELQPAVDALWADEHTQRGVARLRYAFMTRAEALLHGDLHTGSLMASQDETKVVDPEFCFFGPMGFDIGMFIANLFLSAIGHSARSMPSIRDPFARAQMHAAEETWSTFVARADALLADAPIWRLTAADREEFVQQLLRDATGFAGAEMIRRTIGLAHVADLDAIVDSPARIRAKTAALASGRRLISSHQLIDCFDQMVAMVGQTGAAELN